MDAQPKQRSIFRTLDKRRLSDQAVKQILALINEGKLKVGERLPSERKLVQHLGISRVPIREALRKLEEKGLIQVQSGKGAFIIRRPNEIKSDVNFREWLWENRDRVIDLLEIREALEQEAAKYAARRANGDDIRRIDAILKKSKRAIEKDNIDDLIRFDQDFHISISKASKNEFFPYLVEQLTSILHEYRLSSLRLPGSSQQSLSEHRSIFLAIKAGDDTAARKAVYSHFERVRKEIASL